jgi:hypothetical protein
MANTNRFVDNFVKVASVAGAIVSFVQFINLFKHEPGIKKEMYCKNENKVTTHVTISWDDLRNLYRQAIENNLPYLETLPDEKDILLMSLNPLAPKPHLCLTCNNVKWE